MPLETATYISQLVPANPASDDALATAQNHLQLIKEVLQAQFPNLGAAAVAASAADLWAGIGAAVTGLQANAVTTTATGTQNLASGLNLGGSVNATSVQQGGNPLIPSGVIVMWSGAATAIPAGWLLCNGSSGTPNLTNQFVIGAGSTYAPGSTGGLASTTATSSTAGSHNHGGADAVAGPFGMTGSSDVQGTHSHGGSTAGAALTVDELPPHSHPIGVGTISVLGGPNVETVGYATNNASTGNTGSGNPHSHAISADGAHSHNISVSNAPAHQHGISTDGSHNHTVYVPTLPPFYALCFIMKQ